MCIPLSLARFGAGSVGVGDEGGGIGIGIGTGRGVPTTLEKYQHSLKKITVLFAGLQPGEFQTLQTLGERSCNRMSLVFSKEFQTHVVRDSWTLKNIHNRTPQWRLGRREGFEPLICNGSPKQSEQKVFCRTL